LSEPETAFRSGEEPVAAQRALGQAERPPWTTPERAGPALRARKHGVRESISLPEPGTLAMWAMGVEGLTWLTWLQRRGARPAASSGEEVGRARGHEQSRGGESSQRIEHSLRAR